MDLVRSANADFSQKPSTESECEKTERVLERREERADGERRERGERTRETGREREREEE